MSEYYIALSDSEHDRIHLDSPQVDVVNYDNNRGFDVYAVAICDENGQVAREYDFPTREARDEFARENGLEPVNTEWICDLDTWSITVDNGSWTEEIPCKCDLNVAYC